MSLSDWHKAGWLTEHQTSKQEIADLLAVADRDLTDCQVAGLSPDRRLNISYNAALQVAAAALAAAGYRASREAHHYRVIQSWLSRLDLKAILSSSSSNSERSAISVATNEPARFQTRKLAK
jgi:hypothetical protein